MQTRRLGGSYGGKISRSTLVATASAVAATEIGHPVRIQLDLDSNMALGQLGHTYLYFLTFHNREMFFLLQLEEDCHITENIKYVAYNSECANISRIT